MTELLRKLIKKRTNYNGGNYMEHDISETVLKLVQGIIESDVYLEWCAINEEEPFKIETLMLFLAEEPIFIEDEDTEDEE